MQERLLKLLFSDRPTLLEKGVLGLLAVFSYVYGAVQRGREYAYECGWLKTIKVGRPVISVGNLTWGGTGKTPLVEFLVNRLRERGVKVCVLMRGYQPRGLAASGASDEAQLLRRHLPNVLIKEGRDRVRSAAEVMAMDSPDGFILDDGFQHRQIFRDLDIVVLDATRPFGNQRLIPRGILREPVSSLSRAQIVVLTKVDQVSIDALRVLQSDVTRQNPSAVIAHAIHQPVDFWDHRQQSAVPLANLKGRKAVAFCGLGNPQSFFKTLGDVGVEVVDTQSYRDHYVYRLGDVLALSDRARKMGAQLLLSTEKDAVKLESFYEAWAGLDLLILRIKLRFIHGQEFIDQRISHLFKR